MLVEAIVSGDVPFNGSNLINRQDLKELQGGEKNSIHNWLSNFIIDEYLRLVSKKASCNVKVLPWEMFEKSPVDIIAAEMGQNGCFPDYDCILVPCNSVRSHHWFLLAIFPKLQLTIALDSAAIDCEVKATTQAAFKKCNDVISMLSLNSEDWQYHTNSPFEIPQQHNSYDCGVFVCLYSRALVLQDPILHQDEVADFRKMVVLELHRKCLSPNPPKGLELETYYAVDYVTTFYIGRILDRSSSILKCKFLSKSQEGGIPVYYWPRRDDVDTLSPYSVFYGPITFTGICPFVVNDHDEIIKVFNFIKKQRESVV